MPGKTKISVLYICIGKYTLFWKDFYTSCEKYFIPNAEKEYFVFTDAPEIDFEKDNPKVHRIYQENLGWPKNSLLRYEMFLEHVHMWKHSDYAVFFNANAIFLQTIEGEDFLPSGSDTLVAVLHPGFFNKRERQFTYERRPESAACIPKGDGYNYVLGAMNGGKTEAFTEAITSMAHTIKEDFKNDLIAVWIDESHWNRLILNHQQSAQNDVRILSPSYAYIENDYFPFEKKIVLRDKTIFGGYGAIRNEKVNPLQKIRFKLWQIRKKLLKI